MEGRLLLRNQYIIPAVAVLAHEIGRASFFERDPVLSRILTGARSSDPLLLPDTPFYGGSREEARQVRMNGKSCDIGFTQL